MAIVILVIHKLTEVAIAPITMLLLIRDISPPLRAEDPTRLARLL
jgi:hypothetical protein